MLNSQSSRTMSVSKPPLCVCVCVLFFNIMIIVICVKQVKSLVTDLLTQGSSRVKRSLLAHITELCGFMDRKRVNDELLPYLITVLNEREEDWQLRAAFFEHIVGVSVFVGKDIFNSFILPLFVEQALYDVEVSLM